MMDRRMFLAGLAALSACSELGLGAKQHKKRMAITCLLYTSPSPRDLSTSRMPSSA